MKSPAFLFYPNDYIGGTMGMTFEQKGMYIDLLVAQFNRGHMAPHMVREILGQNYDKNWEILSEKFQTDDQGRYFNYRLEVEINKRNAYTASRSSNLSSKNNLKKEEKTDSHMDAHMENENENDNINEISNSEIQTETQNLNGGFMDWVKKNAPKLLTMRSPLTQEQHQKLYVKYGAKKVTDIYLAMQNRPDLVKKYESAYLTARNWLKR
jgi:uncharacterized protein YdaU (DUF1376 family)